MIRYVLNALAVILAFVLASQLKGPIVELLRFWEAFTPAGRELLIFVLLFFGFVIGFFFAIRAMYHRTRLPIVKQLDEIGGAIFGLIFAAMLITFQLLVFDSFFVEGNQTGGWVSSYYDALNDSVLVAVLPRDDHSDRRLPGRPFVPGEIADLLDP